MQRDEIDQLMVSVLYKEASPADRERLQCRLDTHPDEQREFDELSRVIQNLNRIPEPVAAVSSNHLAMPIGKTAKTKWLKYGAWATAACVLLLFCASQGLLIQIGSFQVAFGPAAGDAALQRLVKQEWQDWVQPTMAEIALRMEEIDRRWDLLADRQTSFEQSLNNLTLLRNQDLELQRRSFNQLASRLDQSLDEKMGEFMLISQLPPDSFMTPNSGDGVIIKPE